MELARMEIYSAKEIKDPDIIKQLVSEGKKKLITFQYNQVMAR